MTHDDVVSALQALHNIALALGGIGSALGFIAIALVFYPWLGGFGSHSEKKE